MSGNSHTLRPHSASAPACARGSQQPVLKGHQGLCEQPQACSSDTRRLCLRVRTAWPQAEGGDAPVRWRVSQVLRGRRETPSLGFALLSLVLSDVLLEGEVCFHSDLDVSLDSWGPKGMAFGVCPALGPLLDHGGWLPLLALHSVYGSATPGKGHEVRGHCPGAKWAPHSLASV